MIVIPALAGQTVAIFGLGKSGQATARALRDSGAEVWAWDDSDKSRAEAAAAGIRLVDLAACDWSKAACLVLSPGVPHTHPKPHLVAAAARAAGCAILGDIELLARAQPDATFIGTTGTNGKSTTTALLGHLLAAAGRRVEVGGNLGTPALALAPLGSGGLYVLEMSSYQLELTPTLAFDVAVLLNISPDHLDRHGGMDGYVAAKRRIFRGQKQDATAIVGVDDPYAASIYEELLRAGAASVIPISAERVTAHGVYVEGGVLVDDSRRAATPVLDLGLAPRLPGKHNWQNAAAACAAAVALGLNHAQIAAGLRSYAGLPHRQELVATIEGVRFVNDSKATNADAAGKALACYDPIYWIAGGRPKEGGLAGLEPLFPRIAHAFLIGEAAEGFSRSLAGRVPFTNAGTLAKAVPAAFALARQQARRGGVVLLSPACASFDQFANFEERGAVFTQLVRELDGTNAAGGPQEAARLRRAL